MMLVRSSHVLQAKKKYFFQFSFKVLEFLLATGHQVKFSG